MSNRNQGSAVTQCLLLFGLLLGAIAFSSIGQRERWQSLLRESPDSLHSQSQSENAYGFTLPDTAHAIVIDPTTQAVTLEAIDSD